MEQYINEFIFLASAILLALMSPGPDFMITLKLSLNHERKYAIMGSLGIGMGNMVHLTYTILGFAIIIKTFPMFLDLIRYLAAFYLIYLGYQNLMAHTVIKVNDSKKKMTLKKAFIQGFISNALNPKATMFFLSIFSVIVKETTPMYIQLLFGAFCVGINFLWYSMIVLFLTRKKSLEVFNKYSNYINKIIGIILVVFGFYFIFAL